MTTPDYVAWIRRHLGRQRVLLVYVTAVVFDDSSCVLVQHRADFDWPGLPGGVLEQDEDLSGCAHREVFEETGLDVSVERLVGVYSDPAYNLAYPNGDRVQQWTVCFACRAVGGRIHPDGREIREVRFQPPAEVMPRLPRHYQHMLRDALSASATPAVERVVLAPRGQPGHIMALRRHVGHGRLLFPGAVAVVRDVQGRVLAIRRGDFGTWDMPGGWCDLGETATGTAVRETHEETGLHVWPMRLLGVYSNPAWIVRYPNGDEVRPVGVMYECGVIGGVLCADGEEALDVAFVDPSGQGAHPLDDSPLHTVFWQDVCHPRPEPYIR